MKTCTPDAATMGNGGLNKSVSLLAERCVRSASAIAKTWRETAKAERAWVVVRDSGVECVCLFADSLPAGDSPFVFEFPSIQKLEDSSLFGVVSQQGDSPPIGITDESQLKFITWDQSSDDCGVLLFGKELQSSQEKFHQEYPALSALSQLLVEEMISGTADPVSLAAERDFEARKLESLAEFAAGAGHEINNPLATISGRVQLLLRGETDPEKRHALTTIGGQAYRIRDMIGDVMLYGRPPEPNPEMLDLIAAVNSAVEKLQANFDQRNCRLEIDAEDTVPIWADRTQLQIVISSLFLNSLEAIDDGSTIHVCCRSAVTDGVAKANLTVTDQGTGLSPLDREHLFDPFYSGRQAGRGLGFGLSKCWRIVSNHGGRIDVESDPETATTFRIWWPATEQ